MRILIDGVFFQLAQSGIARVWKSIIPLLIKESDVEIFFLNRGGAPKFENIVRIPFPSYNAVYAPDDSILLEKICAFYNINVFVSTFFTTPLRTPAVQVVYDMIPERFDFDLNNRFWSEKETAFSYARNFVCISETTRNDLLSYYPEIPGEITNVAHLGVDPQVFRQRPKEVIQQFRDRLRLHRPYLLTVGSRSQNKGYKNGRLLFDALTKNKISEFDVLCVGGEDEVEAELLTASKGMFEIIRVDLDDDELSIAYSGAHALIYPSLYEGFGLPVIEAMACGCPVVTTDKGSLSEIVNNDNSVLIDPCSTSDMSRALFLLKDGSLRAKYASGGLECSRKFSWKLIVRELMRAFLNADKQSTEPNYAQFVEKWAALRRAQSEVNTMML